MLIRSQNKEVLINFNTLEGIEIAEGPVKTVITSYITGCSYLLGEYSTKEKALKVLDMIQEAYKNHEKYRTLLMGFNYATTITKSDSISTETLCTVEKALKESSIFQMPTDSEVEV